MAGRLNRGELKVVNQVSRTEIIRYIPMERAA